MKVQWREGQYGAHYLYLANKTLCICISWDSSVPKGNETGYKISFCGVIIKERPKDLERAKQLGITLAKQLLGKALSNIED